ncbi:DEAD/DEAH box helicase family protein [Treponema succinifaciens]|uniref:DEAD/DEAH box helicase family protein n=1 Tax=Treponema succinifaciens TaxID=167 RepID=UPI003FEDABC8
MSVFDALQVKPNHLLFIVHREDILKKAKESFDTICSATEENYSSGFFTGSQKDKNYKYLFA